MSRSCLQCGLNQFHDPKCPEMFWPDGQRRGILRDAPPLPPPLTRKQIENYRIADPGGDSPLAAELSGIFAGINEQAVRNHIAKARRQAEAEDDGIPI